MGTSLPCSIHGITLQTFLYISTLLTASTAAPQYGHAVHAVAPVHAVAHHTGYANPDLSEVSPYTYNYGVADEYSGAAFSQQESNDGTGVVEGSYQVNLPDGRIQTVNYHANDYDGYVAEVSYSGEAAYPEAHAVAHPVAHHAVHAVPLVHAVAHPVAHHAVHAAPLVHAVAHPVAHHAVDAAPLVHAVAHPVAHHA